MAEKKIVQQTIDNIFLKTVRRSMSFYEAALILSIKSYDSTAEQVTRTYVLPQLKTILNSASSTEILKRLKSARSSAWIPGNNNIDRLYLRIDRELEKLYLNLKGLYDEIRSEVEELQRKQSKSDLIADIFTVVKRDMTGIALELQHRASEDVEKNRVPRREYISFQHQLAARLKVLKALDYLLKTDPSFPNSINVPNLPNDLREELRTLFLLLPTDLIIIERWLKELAKRYTSAIWVKYKLQLKDLISYMIDKEERNENSHFKHKIEEYAQQQRQNSHTFCFNNFITTKASLQSVVSTEIKRLQIPFQKYCFYLISFPKLWTNDKIKVINKNNIQLWYNARFVRETEWHYEWHLAKLLPIRDENQNDNEEPHYWNLSRIDRRGYKFSTAHS